ncbi:MAG: alanine--glyoxylate aminotransferase family protein [Candidatus Bathyarchaeia archaeon]
MSERVQLRMLPGPTVVPPRVLRAMAQPIINHRGPEFKELYLKVIEKSKKVFMTKGDLFILSCSGTGGVECAISNAIAPGEKVIIPVNGVFSQRVKRTVEIFGGDPIEIPVEWGSSVDAKAVEEAIKREPDAKALAVVYNETSTGAKVNCMAELGDLCDEKGLLYIVDAISILGGDELPVDDWKVDICITGSQKCLMSPPGLALLSISEKAWSAIERINRAVYFDLKAYRDYLREGETPFTPAIPLFYALDEALDMILEEGMEARIERHRKCANAIYKALEAIGLEIFAKREFRSNTVIGVKDPKGIDGNMIRRIMREKYNVVIAGGMGKLKGTMFRIGSMGNVSIADVLTTISALEGALHELGYKFDRGAGVAAANEAFKS